MSDKSSERGMSALVEARDLVRRIAEPATAGESVKAAIGRASRKLRWNFNRVRSVWYADPRTKISGDELNQLRDVAKQSAGGGDDLLARLEHIEARLRQIDPDFYSADIDTLGRAVGAYRRSYPA